QGHFAQRHPAHTEGSIGLDLHSEGLADALPLDHGTLHAYFFVLWERNRLPVLHDLTGECRDFGPVIVWLRAAAAGGRPYQPRNQDRAEQHPHGSPRTRTVSHHPWGRLPTGRLPTGPTFSKSMTRETLPRDRRAADGPGPW